MTKSRFATSTLLAMLITAGAYAQNAKKPHVLMISVDGMRPDYVTQADAHQLKIPVLRGLLRESTYADGVQGVLPTLTYPSHTTLITGVTPAEHGIISNTIFDPMRVHPGAWYWYFNALKADTLYQAADRADLKTAAISWPVTVGAPIDYLIAESPQSEETDTPNGPLVYPKDLKQQLNVTLPPNPTKDEKVTAWSVGIIQKFTPNLVLVHISNLDHAEHQHGPFSPEADAALEVIDQQIGEIVAAERKADPDAKILITSDHGFATVQHMVNLDALFAQNGLLKLKPGKAPRGTSPIESWDAITWFGGGSAFVVLRDPNDQALIERTRKVLEKLKDDKQYGIHNIYTHDQIVKMGGMHEASFLIDFWPGYSDNNDITAPPLTPASKTLGTHGYMSTYPELRSTFMLSGPGIAKGRDLGVIDMRRIAPTIANLLGVQLHAATLAPIR